MSRFPPIHFDETILAHTKLVEFDRLLQEKDNEALDDGRSGVRPRFLKPPAPRQAGTREPQWPALALDLSRPRSLGATFREICASPSC